MNKKVCTLLFLRKDDKVLLAMKKRGFGEGRWNGIGGKVDKGESIEAAMIRETEEEIEITPTEYEKVGKIHFDEYLKGKQTLIDVHVFIATDWQGEPTETEEMAPKWFSVKELPYDTMWPDDPYWLPQVINGKKILANFKLDTNDIIISHDVKEVETLPHE